MKFKSGKVNEFVEKTKGKKNIFCFGAGKALTEFLEEFESYCLEDDIQYIVDNAKEKQGSAVRCGGRKIQVISPTEMIKMITVEDVILITIMRFAEIIAKQDPIKYFDKIRDMYSQSDSLLLVRRK